MITNRKGALAAAVALGCTVALTPVLPADAAAVPSCVKVSIDDNRRSDTVTVRNTCDTGYKIKVVWAYEIDWPCTYVYAGGSFQSTRDYPARFDGLEFC